MEEGQTKKQDAFDLYQNGYSASFINEKGLNTNQPKP
jgi:hypothetical protein